MLYALEFVSFLFFQYQILENIIEPIRYKIWVICLINDILTQISVFLYRII